MNPTSKLACVFTTLGMLAVAGNASAQVCEETDINDQLQYMRRLSLDLRGTMPTVDEYQGVIDTGAIPDDFIDDALASPDFKHQYGRFLRDLLHVNLDDTTVRNVVNTLTIVPGTTDLYRMNLRGTLYRGGNTSVPCLDQPATFTNGEPDVVCNGGVCQEGYVMVTPYWDPSTQVKVCAFDAQEAATGQYGDCDRNNYDPECGCGPNLDWCYRVDLTPATISKQTGVEYHRTDWQYIKAINEQVTRIGTRILDEDRPYTELLTTTTLEFNGPLVHLLVDKPRVPNYPELDIASYIGPVADLEYTDSDTWVAAEMEGPGTAGVLTSVFFLLRNATNRSRANRFYQSFLCKDFVGPPDGLPPPDDPLELTPNLMKREGCDYCHKELEPASAHWGRWHEVGAQFFDSTTYPDQRMECIGSTDPSCDRYVSTTGHQDEIPYLGYFKPLAFSDSTKADGNDAIAAAVSGGPRALAQKAIDDGAFAACTTQKVYGWMMGREPSDLDAEELSALTAEFVEGGYDFKALVKRLVTSDAYRNHRYVATSATEEQ